MPAILSASYREVCMWQEQVPRDDRAVGDLPDGVDVLVVGAGYCGLGAADGAASAGADVLVLDKEPLGWGASSRNGGMVIPELKAGPEKLAKKIGDLAHRLYEEVEEAFDHTEDLVAQMDCDYRRSGQLYLAHTPRHTPYLRDLAAELQRSGQAVHFLDAAAVTARTGSTAFDSAIFYEKVGGLHPAKFHDGMAKRALAAGAAVHDRTGVTGIRSRAGGFEVETTRGRVRASQVIVGTNAYMDSAVPDLAKRILPINSYIIATEPLTQEQRDVIGPQMMVDTKNLLFYWRLTADGRMIFGGRNRLDPVDIPVARDFLYDNMVRIHPQLQGVAIDYAWTGFVAMTLDRLPHVGTIDGVWYATGCNGTGVSLNGWLGHRLGHVVTGQAPPPAFAELKHPSIPLKPLSPSYVPLVGRYFALQDRR
ncbi:MAG: FAD-binding oxidoreductase [Actinobacteria bacterium]|nr:FAD-binding oxidoreductase [Actinomycetota bacterium]MCB8995682.1 FAD-binding oxidoreductase [Actinomycetota bacterium]HRY11416.1 FAD-dependent oxidoreductase [Candidatus Nanopelagicales bacterium]